MRGDHSRCAYGAHPSQSLRPLLNFVTLQNTPFLNLGETVHTISVVCHINLTNGWMTVLLPCQIDTRQAAILMVGGLQVLYVIVGQKPLVCWRKLNNTKRVARNRIFYFEQFPQIQCHFNTCCTCICWKVGTQTYMYLCPYLKSWGGARLPPTQISSAMFDTGLYVFTPLLR